MKIILSGIGLSAEVNNIYAATYLILPIILCNGEAQILKSRKPFTTFME